MRQPTLLCGNTSARWERLTDEEITELRVALGYTDVELDREVLSRLHGELAQEMERRGLSLAGEPYGAGAPLRLERTAR